MTRDVPSSGEEVNRAASWIPVLPAGWTRARLQHVARVFAGGTPDRTNADYWHGGEVPWLNSGSVNALSITSPSELITEKAVADGRTRWAPAGAVLVALAGQGKTKGTAARLRITSTFNQSVAAIVPSRQNLDDGYLYYWLAMNYTSLRHLSGGDLRDGLNLQLLGAIEVPLPPIDLQRYIADYLDRETAEIDGFIADQEKLIELLIERRSAQVTHLTNSGANGSWPTQALRYSLLYLTSGSRGWAEYYSQSGEPFIRIGDLARGSLEIRTKDRTYVQLPRGVEGSRSKTQAGDLLFSITAYLGSVGLVDRESEGSFVSQHVALARPRTDHFDPQYLGLAALSNPVQQQLRGSAYGGTKIQLALNDIAGLTVPRPPLDEQVAIADRLIGLLRESDATISDAREAIALSKERRAALISAAVTGKIDVRKHGKVKA